MAGEQSRIEVPGFGEGPRGVAASTAAIELILHGLEVSAARDCLSERSRATKLHWETVHLRKHNCEDPDRSSLP